MKQLVIKIKIGSEATLDPYDQATMIEKVADRIRSGHKFGIIRDYNGNKVGSFGFEEEN